jgi:hypothetical protein
MDERKVLAKEVGLLPLQVSKFFSRARQDGRRAGARARARRSRTIAKFKATEKLKVKAEVAEGGGIERTKEEGDLRMASTTDESVYQGALTLIQLSRFNKGL